MVSGLHDVAPDKAGQVSNLIADSSKYGRWYRISTASMRRSICGPVVSRSWGDEHGTDRGRQLRGAGAPAGARDDYSRREPLGPGLGSSIVSPVSPMPCRLRHPDAVQGLASYELPGIGAQLSATLQSKPGAMLAANYAVPNAVVASSLGRNLSGNAPNVTVNLVAPGTRYGDRINQEDVRAPKSCGTGDRERWLRSTSTTR